MTKSELIKEISAQTGEDINQTIKIVEALMKTIKKSLTNNKNVYLRGFGSFIIIKKAKKTARDIRKSKTVIIPEHFAPKFKPVKSFMIEVKENLKKQQYFT